MSSENELIRIPKWFWLLLLGTVAWAGYVNIQLALLTAKLGGLGEIKEAVSAIEKQQATYRSTSESIVDLKSDVKSLDGTVSTLSEQIIRLQVELQYLRERKEGASE